MNAPAYDVLVIGGGHNGLTAAAYLAKAGRRVLVLERRPVVGGTVITETFGEGFAADAVWSGGMLRPDIVKHLGLMKFGYPHAEPRPPFVSLLGEASNSRNQLILDPDMRLAAESIRRFSSQDAARWPEFVGFMNRAAQLLDAAYATIMPRLPRDLDLTDSLGLLELGLDLRLMGRKDMLAIIRMLPMTVIEFLDEWFESPELKAAIASVAIHAVTLGVMSAGTGYTLLHNWLNRGGLSHANVGKAGEITGALAAAATSYGAEIRTGAEVAAVQVDLYKCKGVALARGEQITAKTVLSTVDPKRTFLSLVGPMNLPPEFVWNTQSIKMRGSVAKLHLSTDGRHGVPTGTIALAPSLNYLERAYDAAKYGQISAQPTLEVTTAGTVISIHFQFAAYALKEGNWESERQRIEDLALEALGDHFPKLKSSILDRRLLTPADLESVYGLTEGDLNHGQLMLDQFFFLRPMPGWSDHRTPIDGLYLGGSGVHAGGGVSGAAGRNAARAVLRGG